VHGFGQRKVQKKTFKTRMNAISSLLKERTEIFKKERGGEPRQIKLFGSARQLSFWTTKKIQFLKRKRLKCCKLWLVELGNKLGKERKKPTRKKRNPKMAKTFQVERKIEFKLGSFCCGTTRRGKHVRQEQANKLEPQRKDK